MNIKPLHLNLGVLAFSILMSLAINVGLLSIALPAWEALAAGPLLMIVSWTVITLTLGTLFLVLTLVVRTLTFAALASFNRGIYAFQWLPPADANAMRASRAYREWCFVRDGQTQMGMIIGRLQIVLMGTPRSYPA